MRLRAGASVRDAGRVARLAVLLVLLSGCQLVFGLDDDYAPPVCGPFGEPEPVLFDPQLVGPKDFSVDKTGTSGMVHALYDAGTPRLTRPHVIKKVGGMWMPDPANDQGSIDGLSGGRMMSGGTVFGWIDGAAPRLDEYLPGPPWSPNTLEVVDFEPSYQKRAGNLIEPPVGGGLTVRLLVVTAENDNARTTLQIRRFVRMPPPDNFWVKTGLLDDINTESVQASSGVLTANGDRLVYAAKIGDDPISHLYATRVRVDDSFGLGERLDIPGNTNEANVTEPWINDNCTAIYFNRDGVILTARALDDQGSAQ
jgi:hypothetical protein